MTSNKFYFLLIIKQDKKKDMDSTKLSQLLNRFEKYVDVAETASTLSGDEQLAKFEALVTRLEKARAAGGAPA